jgi:hypothetical protein
MTTISRAWRLSGKDRIRLRPHDVSAGLPGSFKPQCCRFQDFHEEPKTIEYKLPYEGQWKVFLCRMMGHENTPIEVDVIQVPASENQKRTPA